MATIYVDNKAYEVDASANLLHVCLSLGLDIPYFCWHPAMGSVGACRQCAVKQFQNEEDTRGRIVISCMTPAADGTRISIEDADAAAFRASVIEWLMTNHPHDCPICDEGGECHLQDMTVMTGHAYRRFRFKKRTYRNQYLGPFINHEMNRCIQCYRCVRFYREYAGGHDLDVFASRNRVYFGRHEDGVLENEFSGNLVEVCPTGVFTDKTLKQHYTRKWDLQTAPSICVHCGVGCNTIAGERYGGLRRILNRYNGQVNGYFICDRGRFGYEFVNHERRLRQAFLRREGAEYPEPTAVGKAMKHLSTLLSNGAKVIGIGSPRASLEANFALRTLVGEDRFYNGMAQRESNLVNLALKILREGPARSPSLHDVEQCDAVLVLGEDVTNTAPMLALALRQSVRQQPKAIADALGIASWHDAGVREAVQRETGPLYVATPASTKLDDVATQTYHAAPDDVARLGFAVAHALNGDAPAAPDLPGELRELAEQIAQDLKEAERPLIISGASCGSEAIMQAAANVAWALHDPDRDSPVQLGFTVPEPNSLGVAMLGEQDLEAALKAVESGAADTVVILENDLYRRADAARVDAFLQAAGHVVVVDHLANRTNEKAEVILPAGTFAEADGTLVNNEGRAQRFYQVFVPEGEVQESWRWLRDMMRATGRSEASEWRGLDAITAALAETMLLFRAIPEIAPPAGFRIAGMKVPRQSHRYSGRTAMRADINVHEPRPPDDPDSPLTFSMEGYHGPPPSAVIPLIWAPAWNSAQAINKFQSEVGGPLHGGDPGRRLIEHAQVERVAFFDQVPPPFAASENEWLVAPLYHIFGAEELSTLAPAIAERAPEPYLALSAADAERLRVSEGDTVAVELGATQELPVRILPSLPSGVAGLPVGLPGLEGIDLPTLSKISHSGKVS